MEFVIRQQETTSGDLRPKRAWRAAGTLGFSLINMEEKAIAPSLALALANPMDGGL